MDRFFDRCPPPLKKHLHANNSQLLDLKKKEKLPDIDECSSVLETYRNSQIWIMGEEKFKNCCKIVAFGLDLWPSIGIDMGEFHRKEGINPTLTDSAVEQVGGFLNTFFNALYLTENDKLLTLLKELTAATSAAHRLNFAVSYGFLPVLFRDFLSEKFPDFWKHVNVDHTAVMVPMASPNLRRSPRKHASSSKPVQAASPRPARAKKTMFQHCEVLNDESSGEEDDGIDGVEYVSSQTHAVQAGDSKTPDSNTASIILSQVNIASLTSPCTDHPTENANLLCYDELVMEIPAMLLQSWSMKFYPKQKEVPF